MVRGGQRGCQEEAGGADEGARRKGIEIRENRG